MPTDPDDFTRQEHAARAVEMYLRRKTQRQIAAALGISQPTVSRYLRAAERKWAAENAHNLDALKAEELERIRVLEVDYQEGYERSKQQRRRTRTKTRHGGGGGRAGDAGTPVEVEVTTEQPVGDPRFLDGVKWCVEQRAKIFGMYAPERHQVTYTDEEMDGMTDDELEILAAGRLLPLSRRPPAAGQGAAEAPGAANGAA